MYFEVKEESLLFSITRKNTKRPHNFASWYGIWYASFSLPPLQLGSGSSVSGWWNLWNYYLQHAKAFRSVPESSTHHQHNTFTLTSCAGYLPLTSVLSLTEHFLYRTTTTSIPHLAKATAQSFLAKGRRPKFLYNWKFTNAHTASATIAVESLGARSASRFHPIASRAFSSDGVADSDHLGGVRQGQQSLSLSLSLSLAHFFR